MKSGADGGKWKKAFRNPRKKVNKLLNIFISDFADKL